MQSDVIKSIHDHPFVYMYIVAGENCHTKIAHVNTPFAQLVVNPKGNNKVQLNTFFWNNSVLRRKTTVCSFILKQTFAERRQANHVTN